MESLLSTTSLVEEESEVPVWRHCWVRQRSALLALPRPGGYYSGYAHHIMRATIRMFKASRQGLIADGMDELEATHKVPT